MQAYSPFERSINELTASDLSVLRTAKEGWYIEYKRELPNASSIAKSISAFANTYGGWLFYGIAELSKTEPIADGFPGVPQSSVDGALQSLRNAVGAQLAPTPHFESAVVHGPDADLGLPADRAIIIIRVPWGPAAPYVHKDGRIYRRVADGSDPRPENDRFVLDQLWKRADDIKKDYRDWFEKDPPVSQAEENSSYLRMLVVADIWGDHETWTDLSVDEIRQIVSRSEGFVALPFDTVYSSATGVVCRQVADNDPSLMGLTWRFRRDLTSEIIVPLARFEDEPHSLMRHLHGYEHAKRFLRLLSARGFREPAIIDLNLLFHVMLGLMRIQKEFSARAAWRGPLHLQVKLVNMWRTIPFLDIERYVEELERHGVPLCLEKNIHLFPASPPYSFMTLPEQNDLDDDAHRLLMAYVAFHPIATALGIPETDIASGGFSAEFISEYLAAGARAIEVQRRRVERAASAATEY